MVLIDTAKTFYGTPSGVREGERERERGSTLLSDELAAACTLLRIQ